MCDLEVMSQAQQGDMSAFEALVERHRDSAYAFALRLTRSEADASEIVQESFLSAYLHLNEFRTEAEFAEWVHWIAAGHTSLRMTVMRRAQASKAQLDAPKCLACGALAKHTGTDWTKEIDEQPLSAELRRAIEDATERLPHRHRRVFLFKDVAGLNYEQIAQICGESIPAIKSRLHQARLSLREAIDKFYTAGVDHSTKAKLTKQTPKGDDSAG
jgi:RNA polymerase sigma-70 factor (ECF subfamily)